MSNLRFFRTFILVARAGSLAAAADKVGLTQAAISLQIRTLETELGAEFFDRSGRGLVLNAAGRHLLPQAERLVALYDELRSSLAGDGGMAGEVALGAVVSAMGGLARSVTELKQLHPALEIRLVTGKSTELVDQVLKGGLDAALIAEPPGRLSAQFDWTPLYAEPLVVLASRARAGIPPEDLLANHPFLRFDRRTHTGALIEAALRRREIEVHDLLDLNSLETIAELVRQDIGVSLVPLLRGADWTSDPRLTVLPLKGIAEERVVGLIEPVGHPRATVIRAIRDQLSGPSSATN